MHTPKMPRPRESKTILGSRTASVFSRTTAPSTRHRTQCRMALNHRRQDHHEHTQAATPATKDTSLE